MEGNIKPSVDVGILTIRDDEFRAVLNVFPVGHAIHKGQHREYTIREAEAGGGKKYRLAILRQIEQGNGEAQDAARDLIDDLQPSLLLLVGIAGGLPSEDISLGDVVLSTRIQDFSVESRKYNEQTTYNVGGGPIRKQIAAGVANLSAREDELGEWYSELPQKPPVSFGAEELYGSEDWQNDVRQSLQTHFGESARSRHPVFAAGSIASSDRLIKDPSVLIPWISSARGTLAVEMESAGVHRATRDNTPMLSIRALSDIVGLKRQDAWTKYACASAALFSRAYLKTQPIPTRRSLGTLESDGEAIDTQDALSVININPNGSSENPRKQQATVQYPPTDVSLSLTPLKNRFWICIGFNRHYPGFADTGGSYVEIPIPKDKFLGRIDALLSTWRRTFSGPGPVSSQPIF